MKLHDENLEQVAEPIEADFAQPIEEVEVELTDAQIAAWKAEHGKIFKNTVNDEVYVWRRLNRREYVDAMSFTSETNPEENLYLRQNLIAMEVTLYPSKHIMAERIQQYAGLAGEISDRSILKSGFEVSKTEEL